MSTRRGQNKIEHRMREPLQQRQYRMPGRREGRSKHPRGDERDLMNWLGDGNKFRPHASPAMSPGQAPAPQDR